MVFSSGQSLALLAQQHRLVEAVAMGGGNGQHIVNAGGGMQLVAQLPIS